MDVPTSFRWRPATTVILITGVVVLLVALVLSYIATNFKPTVDVRLGSGLYGLWVADNDAELAQGLSGVEELPANGGLLMKFDKPNNWGIWMKDMLVPLDIIWLDQNKTVVYIVKNASPDLSTDTTFVPEKKALYVIELPAGSVKNSGISTGDTVEFDETDDGELW